MSTVSYEHDEVVRNLSEIFGIEWRPDVMAYEEPHIFRSAPPARGPLEQADAEQ